MGSHPINLIFRFLLEIAAFISVGFWGYSHSEGFYALILAIIFPAIIATLWGVFAVPDDPSRSGKTVIKTPGPIRLILELLIFAFATYSLYTSGFSTLAWVFGLLVIVHYAISYDRVRWLLKKETKSEK